jgi:hypothetical protein
VVARRIKVQARRYQDLSAWQQAIEFVQAVYAISSKFPQERDVWIEEPAETGCGFSSKQCRGTGTRQSRGIPARLAETFHPNIGFATTDNPQLTTDNFYG